MSFRRNITSQSESEYFQAVLIRSGMKLTSDTGEEQDKENQLVILIQEQALVIIDLEKFLNEKSHNISKFLKGLTVFLNNECNFQQALLPTQLMKPGLETMTMKQECLIRILMHVKCLQSAIIDMVLEQLITQVSNEIEETGWIRKLLFSLRYLPFINKPKELSSKLLDALEIATFPSQLEILTYIPEIVPDDFYDEVAKPLCKLLEENEDLTGSIIDCLNAFNLNQETIYTIQEYITEQLLGSTRYYKIFPILFQFLVTGYKSDNLIPILFKARNTFDNILKTESEEIEVITNKLVVCKELQILISRRKNVFDGLMGMISTIADSSKHKPIDIIILFMLHSINNSNKTLIEATFKKRIKAGLFKIDLIEKTFEKCFIQHLFNSYFQSMLDIANCLVLVNDHVVVETGSLMIKLIFCSPLCTSFQRQDILYSLILLMGINECKNAATVLDILNSLLGEEKLKEHSLLLMGLLRMTEDLELKEVKKLYEILCKLTCAEDSDESVTGLKDEIHMLIRKQLASNKKDTQHRGIVSGVVMAKHMAATGESLNEISFSEENISIYDLPLGKPQDIAKLFDMINKCTSNIPNLCGLYYDQLSAMIVDSGDMEPNSIYWLFTKITNEFESAFITDMTEERVGPIKLTFHHSLNTENEVDEPIGIRMGNLIIVNNQTKANVLILSPLFRLLRILSQKQHNGDLSTIDALLGCGVVLPEHANIESMDIDHVKLIADCIFHCINWFRELISAFVTQNTKKLRKKVLQRLMHLVELEDQLDKCMEIIPDHKLPSSYFDHITQNIPKSPSKIGKTLTGRPPSKKQKTTNPTQNDTIASTSALPTQRTQAGSKSKVSKFDYNYKFRELDTDVIVLIKYPLNLNQSQTQESTYLHIKQFQYILKDFVCKLSVLTKYKNLGLSHLSIVDVEKLIKSCGRLIPNIHVQTSVITEKLKSELESVDGILDDPHMFTDEVVDLKITIALIFEFYSLIFSWVGFQHVKNEKLLIICLRTFQGETSSPINVPINKLIMDFLDALTSYVDQCLYLPAAISMIETMQSLYKVQMGPLVKKKVVSVSEKLLQRKWYNLQGNRETGRNAFAHIDILVKAYLQDAKIKTICGLVGTLQEQIPNLATKTSSLEMLESIDRANFHVFYRGLCYALAEGVKIEIVSLTNTEHLALWRTTTLTMQGLMTVAKMHKSKGELATFLKKSIIILKQFYTHGIPVLEIMLKSKTDEVLEIFKILQSSTRFLHHLCCYTKAMKNSSLISYIPQYRSIVETLIYRVKALLVANNCQQAFWMGILKNKNLDEEDIISQSTGTTTEIMEEDDEEQLPMDESDNEDLLSLANEDCTSQGSASELFDIV